MLRVGVQRGVPDEEGVLKLIRGQEIALEPASHEDPTDPGVWKKVLASKSDLQFGQVQMLNWSLLKSGKAFQRHYHEDMQEVFYIIQGRVSVNVEQADRKQQYLLQAGDVIVIDPREIHSMRNDDSEDAIYLVFGISAEKNGRTVVVD